MANKPSSRVNIILSLKDDFSRGISKAMLKMDRFAASAKRAGLAMVGAGVAIGAVLGKTVIMAGKLDTKIRSLATKLQKSFDSKEVDMLTKKMRHLGATTSYTTSQVADLMIILAQSGKSADEIDKMTASVMNLAKATGTDAAQSAGILSDIMGTFHIDAKDAAHVADVLTKTASASNQTLADLGEGFKGIGAAAFTAGQSFETTASMLAMLANEGLRGSAAGRGLRSGLLKAITAGKSTLDKFGVAIKTANGEMRDMPDILRDFNLAIRNLDDDKKLEAIDKAFGKIGLTAAAILGNNANKAKDFRVELEKLEGTAKKAAGDMLGGIEGSFAKLMSRLEALALVVGEKLVPIINKLIKAIDKLLDNKELVALLGKLAVVALAAVPALILLGGALITLGSSMQVVIGSASLLASTGLGVISILSAPIGVGLKSLPAIFANSTKAVKALGANYVATARALGKSSGIFEAKAAVKLANARVKQAVKLMQVDKFGNKQLQNINRLAKNRVGLEQQAVRAGKELARVQKGILQTNIDLAKLTPAQNPTTLKADLAMLKSKERFLVGARTDTMSALSKIAAKERTTSYLANLANVKKLEKARMASAIATGKLVVKAIPMNLASSMISPIMGAVMVADATAKVASGVVPYAKMVGHAFSTETYKGLFEGGMAAIKTITTSIPDLMEVAGMNGGKNFWEAFTEVGIGAMNDMYQNLPAGLKNTLDKVDKIEGSAAGQTTSSLAFGTGQMGRMLMSPIDAAIEGALAIGFQESSYREGEKATFGRAAGLMFGQLRALDAQAERDAARPMAYGTSDYENRFGVPVDQYYGKDAQSLDAKYIVDRLIPKDTLTGKEDTRTRVNAVKLKSVLLDAFSATEDGILMYSDKKLQKMTELYKKHGRIAISSAEMTEASFARTRQKNEEMLKKVSEKSKIDKLNNLIDSNLIVSSIERMVQRQTMGAKVGRGVSGLMSSASNILSAATLSVPSKDPFLNPEPAFQMNLAEAVRQGMEGVSYLRDMVVDNKKDIAQKRLDQLKKEAQSVKLTKDSFGALGGVGVRQKLADKQNEVQEQQLDAQIRMAESLRNIEQQQLTAIVAE